MWPGFALAATLSGVISLLFADLTMQWRRCIDARSTAGTGAAPQAPTVLRGREHC